MTSTPLSVIEAFKPVVWIVTTTITMLVVISSATRTTTVTTSRVPMTTCLPLLIGAVMRWLTWLLIVKLLIAHVRVWRRTDRHHTLRGSTCIRYLLRWIAIWLVICAYHTLIVVMRRSLVEWITHIWLLLLMLVSGLWLLSSSFGLEVLSSVIGLLLVATISLSSLKLSEASLSSVTTTSLAVLMIISHICLLEVTIVVCLILASVSIIVSSMVVLIAKAISMVQPAVNL